MGIGRRGLVMGCLVFLLASCSQDSIGENLVGHWQSSSGTKLELLKGGTFLSNPDFSPGGTWTVADEGRVILTTTVFGTTVNMTGRIVSPNALYLSISPEDGEERFVHVYKSESGGKASGPMPKNEKVIEFQNGQGTVHYSESADQLTITARIPADHVLAFWADTNGDGKPTPGIERFFYNPADGQNCVQDIATSTGCLDTGSSAKLKMTVDGGSKTMEWKIAKRELSADGFTTRLMFQGGTIDGRASYSGRAYLGFGRPVR